MLDDNDNDNDNDNSSHEPGADGKAQQMPPALRRPADTSLKQQRMAAWSPILHPVWVIWTYFIIGVILIPCGWKLRQVSNNVVEYSLKYDTHAEDMDNLQWTDCSIDVPNEGRDCIFSLQVEQDMSAPVLVYYEIDNFHQNHLEYVVSKDPNQLLGSLNQDPLSAANCSPLNKLGNITINPCGLVWLKTGV